MPSAGPPDASEPVLTLDAVAVVAVLAFAPDTTNQLIAAGAALGGAIIGGVITLIGIVLQNRFSRSERRAEAAAARRERAAAVLGRVRTFLTDVNPERVGINVDAERTPRTLEELNVRLAALRDELSIFAGSDEDDRVRDRTAALEVALFNTFNFVGWHVHDLIHRSDNVLRSLGIARRSHDRSLILLRIVLDLVRGHDVAELEVQLRRLEQETPGGSSPSSAP